MKIKAYSKINLGLSIDPTPFSFTDKHHLKSIFYLYKDLHDDIEIRESSKDEIVYIKDNEQLVIENCLIKRSLDYLREKKLISKNYSIKVKKAIWMSAGLGGGSSDAASTILTILDYENVNKAKLDYLDIALKLSSDIPFFLEGCDSAIVEEFGNKITPIELKDNWIIKIYDQFVQVSTNLIYKKLINNYKIKQVESNDFLKIRDDLNSGNLPSIFNDFQEIIFDEFPSVKRAYCELRNSHDFVVMSGSGPTMISIDKKDRKIRTRYAPSPTGYFHIGGARTAIFNYLFAKHFGGEFIVRIEDTDVERNVEGGIESQLDNLAWLGIIPDESVNNPGKFGPYIQSAKLERYKSLAHKLLEEGKAYYCFCSEEQLEKDRQDALDNHQTPRYSKRCLHLSKEEIQANLAKNIPHVIRLKIDDNKNYEWEDLIRGKISVPGTAMTDPVILKSNGIAMYNFAVVVDDYDMDITHILRGEEHISNTPYQIAIKEALGFDSKDIRYGHLSVIIDETGKKLSKRNKTLKQFVSDYKEMGFVPESIVNFLALLGWSPANNQEIMSKQDLIHEFNIDNLSKSSTFFDFKKLLWIGNEYFKLMPKEEYIEFVKPWILKESNLAILNQHLLDNLDMLLMLFKEQISYADELSNLLVEYFGTKELNLDDEMRQIILENKDVVLTFRDLLCEIESFNEESIKNLINDVKSSTSKKGKNLFMPIRIASTWMMHGPELAKIIYLTGKDKVLQNIDEVIYEIEN